MKPPFHWKIFLGELALYTVLVLTYFLAVLHYLLGWLKGLYDHDRTSFAIVALLLMIGQAAVLEVLSSFLFGLIRGKRK